MTQNQNDTIDSRTSHVIYTDGACSGNPGVGGWAFLHYSPDGFIFEQSGYSPSTTNNRMELTAAIEGLKRTEGNDPIILLTDSVYVIRGITQWIFAWQRRGWKSMEGGEVLNKDLWQELFQVVRGKKIDWRYVRGHIGINGNERVDQMAVAHSKGSPIAPYRGPLDTYNMALFPLPPKGPLPEMKKKGGTDSNKNNGVHPYYLSLVHGVLERHETWDSCQGRIKGVSQAKFKKIQSPEEAETIMKSWGLNPAMVPLKR